MAEWRRFFENGIEIDGQYYDTKYIDGDGNCLFRSIISHDDFPMTEWVDKGLTSIYQPGDIAINKPLKDYIRRAYHQFLTEKLGAVVPGQTLKISREELTLMVETAFNKINDEQKRKMSIYQSFKLCGLSPWDEELVEFKGHLDSLSTNSIYASLLNNQEALNLK